MKNFIIAIRIIEICCVALFLTVVSAGTARAQSQTFVAAEGLDTNPCTQAKPCQTINRALSLTPAGGEVLVLDSGAYEPFTVTKAVTVAAATGIDANIAVTFGDGIDVNAGTTDIVALRGLKIFGPNNIGSGIKYGTGGTLQIERCIVSNFNANQAPCNGIYIAGPGNIFVKDTTLSGNGVGFNLDFRSLGTASATVSLDNVYVYGNQDAIDLTLGQSQTLNGVIRNSQLDGNLGGGLSTQASASSVLSVDVQGCSISQDTIGIYIANLYQAQTSVSINSCDIARNFQAGYYIINSANPTSAVNLYSRGNNVLIGNGSDVGSLTPLTGQ